MRRKRARMVWEGKGQGGYEKAKGKDGMGRKRAGRL